MRHVDILEAQPAMRGRVQEVDFHAFRQGQPGGVTGDNQNGIALARFVRCGDCHNKKHVRDRAIGDIGFFAIEDKAVTRPFGRGLQVLGMSSGTGF